MRSSAAPQGRKELLFWLNGLCNSDYPAVESLRDGAAYCTILEASANRITRNYEASDPSPEAAAARRRAAAAAAALGRLDWSATAAVCESADPARDSMAVHKACRGNTAVLQEMLRACVPAGHTLEVDTARLSTGKLQDHMLFLRWLHQFMGRALQHYSRAALEKRAAARPGEVEGVKLNRAQLLLERKRQSGGRPGTRGASAAEMAVTPSSRRAVSAAAAAVRSPSPRTALMESFEPSGGGGGGYATPDSREGRAQPQNYHVDPTANTRSIPNIYTNSTNIGGGGGGGAPPTPPELATADVGATTTSGGSNGFAYPRAAVAVPAPMRDMLVAARREVEELEAMVAAAHERHLHHLTRPSADDSHSGDGDGGGDTPDPLAHSAAERQLAAARDADPDGDDGEAVGLVSLQDLGRLLEERDAMAQVFAAVDGVVRQCHAQGVPSRLLSDVCAVLYP